MKTATTPSTEQADSYTVKQVYLVKCSYPFASPIFDTEAEAKAWALVQQRINQRKERLPFLEPKFFTDSEDLAINAGDFVSEIAKNLDAYVNAVKLLSAVFPLEPCMLGAGDADRLAVLTATVAHPHGVA
jgi:hypothetical protein